MAVSREDALRQLERIASSEAFRDSEPQRKLLLYIGETTLDGHAEELKEYAVGLEVLGRPAHYDPRTDSSARMLAARVRRKLEDYYRCEGAADPLRVGFPKGGFKLTFEHAGPQPPTLSSNPWKWAAIACFAAFLVAAGIAIFRPEAQTAHAWTGDLEALWGPLTRDHTPIVVSYGSPMFLAAGRCNLRWPSVNTPAEAASSADVARVLKFLGVEDMRPMYDYVGLGDLQGAFLVARLLAGHKSEVLLKRGVVLSWEDIKNNHVVFLGNGKNQERLRYILGRGEFELAPAGVRNLKPRKGEPALFENVQPSAPGKSRVEHGVITFLPGAEQGRQMLILSADSTGGIWAATEAVTNPRLASSLVAGLRSRGELPKSFQMVIRMRLEADVPVDAAYVTHHEMAPSDGR